MKTGSIALLLAAAITAFPGAAKAADRGGDETKAWAMGMFGAIMGLAQCEAEKERARKAGQPQPSCAPNVAYPTQPPQAYPTQPPQIYRVQPAAPPPELPPIPSPGRGNEWSGSAPGR